MNALSRGVRNAFRNSVRAIAIIGMLGLSIGLALSMLLARIAIGQKISSVQQGIANTVTITPAGIRGFDGGGNPLTNDQASKVKMTAHVTGIDETLTDRANSSDTSLQSAIDAGNFGRRQFRVQSSAGDTEINPNQAMPDLSNFKLPVSFVGASNPLAGQVTANGSSLTLSSGSSFDGAKDADVALLGTTLASKNNLKVGSTFTAYGETFTVDGIFDAGNTFSNAQAIVPLPTLQRLSQQSGAITAITAHIDSALNLSSTTSAIKNQLGDAADVVSSADAAKSTLDSLQNIQQISLVTLVGATATAGAIILLTMVMIVRERRREIGVLKAIGSSNLRIMIQFTVEAITLTVLAALVGIIIGSMTATPITKLLANNSPNNSSAAQQVGPGQSPRQFAAGGGIGMGGGFRMRFQNNSVARGIQNLHANVNGNIFLYGLGGGVLIAVIGSTAAAGLIAKVRPSEVMRAE